MNNKKKILKMVYNNKMSPEEAALSYKNMLKKEDVKEVKESNVFDIAIVGIAGQFPGAKNTDEFWENLKNGENQIKEITRWDMSAIYNPNKNVPNKTYCKHGGLLDDIDKFDPLFFDLSPRQGEFMEPRQRMFLQEAWKALEDAGYSNKDLAGKKCGVFVGCEGSTHYFDNINKEQFNPHIFLGDSNSALASRIAYFLDLKGPSVTIDTACSSSLVSIHLACESIRNGDCEMAIAGGVTIMTLAEGYILLSSLGMLSPEGKCKAFDNSADGFVPGEGVGVVVLKPLETAMKDKDNIYGVIKGSSINQDGKTNGLTAPSSLSQTRLQLDVYEKFNINPETITYIEAHGTGTPLGDPIEIEALKNSFGKYTDKIQFCAIGSVKTNIGHAAASAGISGIIKIILAMKHKKIPANLHFKEPNNNIDFENSPFYVVTELQEWTVADGTPRRSAISSFGHSGTNCHMVLEEAPYYPEKINSHTKAPYYIAPLSAKTNEALHLRIKDFKKWLDEEGDKYDLEDILFTLQVGRSHFNKRCAVVFKDKNELKAKLTMLMENETPKDCFIVKNVEEILREDRDLANNALDYIMENNFDYMKSMEYFKNILMIAKAYVYGNDIEWKKLYENSEAKRISLPVYPFARRKYWIKNESNIKGKNEVTHSNTRLDTLIDVNSSTLEEQSFKKVLTGKEFFIKDHNKVLPAVVYLEMARAAGNLSYTEGTVKTIKNVVWMTPIIVADELVETKIALYPSGQYVDFEIYTITDDKNITKHSQGKIGYDTITSFEENIDIKSIIGRCSGGRKEAKAYYNKIDSFGGYLGSRFKGLKAFYYNENEAITLLDIVPEIEDSINDFVIHPTLADGGIQSAVAFAYKTGANTDEMYLPFSIDEMNILNSDNRIKYAYITKSKELVNVNVQQYKYDVLYLDEKGKVLISLKGLTIRPVQQNLVNIAMSGTESSNVYYYTKVWEKDSLDKDSIEYRKCDSIILFHNDRFDLDYKHNEIKNKNIIRVKKGLDYVKKDRLSYEINPMKKEHYFRLLKNIREDNMSINNIIYTWNSLVNLTNEKEIGQIFMPVFLLTKTISENKDLKNTKMILVYETSDLYTSLTNEAFEGFIKCLEIENPRLNFNIVRINTDSTSILNKKIITKIMVDELLYRTNEKNMQIFYHNNERFVSSIKEYNYRNVSYMISAPLKKGGTYIITGGTGKIGYLFARHICKNYNGKVVLIGRSSAESKQEKMLDELKQLGGEAIYISADISQYDDVKKSLDKAIEVFGGINGVLHCAGTIKDSFLINKDVKDAMSVIEPKVLGALNLDKYLKNATLDFFVMFSSTTSIVGNAGQTDYGYANAFLDSFANWSRENRNYGRCLSINWPLWKDGGMKVDKSTERLIYTTSGMVPLGNQNGIDAFHFALEQYENNIIVIPGNQDKINKTLSITNKNEIKHNQEALQDLVLSDKEGLFEQFNKDFLIIASMVTNIPFNEIDVDKSVEEFGFDSITFTELANKLNDKFEMNITPAVFFGHPSLKSIAKNLFAEYTEDIVKYYSKDNDTETNINELSKEKIHLPLNIFNEEYKQKNKFKETRGRFLNNMLKSDEHTKQKIFENEQIAIIGMNCSMPLSEDVEEYWSNLLSGCDMITEIPKDRWDWREYYGEPDTNSKKTTVKWGGFMKEVDKFDSMFFNISPREATLMDPQERLTIESVWKTIEDAGYRASELSGSKTGVYIGVTNADYKEILIQNGVLTVMTQAMVANRVSYLLNLRGPCGPVDTACSSSLVAIHKAVESIRTGECDLAIAGGVNLILSPNTVIYQSIAGMLSRTGKCKSFDKDADGYVRGEGVGTILLKPLSKAQRDGDHIYAVIRGTSLNHGGRGSSLTSPNSDAQAEVIIKAHEKAGVDPSTIRYIEAHGTGTKLGDPVEIEGLKKAFNKLYGKWGIEKINKHSSAIGTVKANIGHLESASGIAGVIKTVLCMKHQVILGVHGFKELNPYIQLEDTPFYIPTNTEIWNEMYDENNNYIPRRAGISSFGIGGVNAHIVLEEYVDEYDDQSYNKDEPEIIVLSAKNTNILKQSANNLLQYINKIIAEGEEEFEQGIKKNLPDKNVLLKILARELNIQPSEIDVNESLVDHGMDCFSVNRFVETINEFFDSSISIDQLQLGMPLIELIDLIIKNSNIQDKTKKNVHSIGLKNIAYTLQVGREPMERRLAIVVRSLQELKNKLKSFIDNKHYNVSGIFNEPLTSKEENINISIEELIENKKLYEIAKLWVSHVNIPWERFYYEDKVRRISLPGYQFEKERHWFNALQNKTEKSIDYKENKIESKQEKHTKLTTEKLEKKEKDKRLMELLKKLETGRIKIETIEKEFGGNIDE